MPRSNRSADRSLTERIRELEPDILGRLRQRFPDVPPGAGLTFRPLPGGRSHHMILAQTTGGPVRRLLVKGPRKMQGTRHRLETEHRLLTEVAPRVSAQNPLTRSPDVLGYYPEQEVLLLEMVEGRTLKSLLFGLGQPRDRTRLRELLRSCGEWLARFHDLTRTGELGNPLEALWEAWEQPSTRRIFERYTARGDYEALGGLAERFRPALTGLRAPLCTIHGGFIPDHVLVDDDRIYVIDFEQSRTGYAFEDLCSFAAYCHVLVPWRRALAALRIGGGVWQGILGDSYAARGARACGAAEEILMPFARVLAVARLLVFLESSGLPMGRVRSRVVGAWWRHRFRVACREELAALEQRARAL